MQDKPAEYPPVGHTHAKADITDFPVALPANGGNADTVGGFNILGLLPVRTERDFTNGTLIQSSIDYSKTNGDPWLLEMTGNSYAAVIPIDFKYQGYIYNDTIINHGGLCAGAEITGLVAFNYGGKLCFWFPRLAYWQGFAIMLTTSHIGYGNAVNRVTLVSDVAKPTDISKVVSLDNIKYL